MAKDNTSEAPPVEESAKAVEKPQAVIKVVSIPLDVEYTEPDGWVLKEIHSVDVEAGKFFGVLVKILEAAPKGMRMGPRVPLKKES